MAKNQTVRLSEKTLLRDRNSYLALKDVTGYAPTNSDFTVAKGQTGLTNINAAQEAEVQAQATANAERDNAVAAEWEFHNYVLGAKEQVIAQFGKDSNEVQSIGLKRKSEYKSPKRKLTLLKAA